MENYLGYSILLGKRTNHPLIGKNFPFLVPSSGSSERKRLSLSIENSDECPTIKSSFIVEGGSPEKFQETTENNHLLENLQFEDLEEELFCLREILEELLANERINLLSYSMLRHSTKTLLSSFLLQKYSRSLLLILEKPCERSSTFFKIHSFRNLNKQPYNKKLTLEIRSKILFLRMIEDNQAIQIDIFIRNFTRLYLPRFHAKHKKTNAAEYMRTAYHYACRDKATFKSCELPFESWLPYFVRYLEELQKIDFKKVEEVYTERSKKRLDQIFQTMSESLQAKSDCQLEDVYSPDLQIPLTLDELEYVDSEFLEDMKSDCQVLKKVLEIYSERPLSSIGLDQSMAQFKKGDYERNEIAEKRLVEQEYSSDVSDDAIEGDSSE